MMEDRVDNILFFIVGGRTLLILHFLCESFRVYEETLFKRFLTVAALALFRFGVLGLVNGEGWL